MDSKKRRKAEMANPVPPPLTQAPTEPISERTNNSHWFPVRIQYTLFYENHIKYFEPQIILKNFRSNFQFSHRHLPKILSDSLNLLSHLDQVTKSANEIFVNFGKTFHEK